LIPGVDANFCGAALEAYLLRTHKRNQNPLVPSSVNLRYCFCGLCDFLQQPAHSADKQDEDEKETYVFSFD
jgi:hypothetical protein